MLLSIEGLIIFRDRKNEGLEMTKPGICKNGSQNYTSRGFKFVELNYMMLAGIDTLT